jgi:predicted nuclease of restriction endonuclease-like RecB superfamily
MKKGAKHSEETRQKMRATQKLRAPSSQETRDKIRETLTGTKRPAEVVAKFSKTLKGMKYNLSDEERKARSERMRGKNNPQYGKPCTYIGKRGKWTEYDGVMYRSTWDARTAKALDIQKRKFEYEPERFYFDDCTYLPDFYLTDEDVYWEIKGWLDEESKKRIDTFRKVYPEKKLVVITEELLQLLEQSVS